MQKKNKIKKEKYKLSSFIKKKVTRQFNILNNITGTKFIKKYHEGKVGNPKALYLKSMLLYIRDLFAIYHAWEINKKLKKSFNNNPFFLEIGPGVGNLAVKLKKLFPGSTIILIDLPEVNAIQSFYIFKNFPNAKVYRYKEYKRYGINYLFKKKFDFAVLPFWLINNIQNSSIDLAINIRSMMEMNIKTVQDYMVHINRIVKVNGFFYCVNRYEKRSSDYPIRIKDYSFGDNWYFVESKRSKQQIWIHELIARKTDLKNAYPPNKVLDELHPLPLKNIFGLLKKILCILKNKIITNDERTYHKSINAIFRNISSPLRSKLKIRTRINKIFK